LKPDRLWKGKTEQENAETVGSEPDRESLRLQEDARREKNWKRWGPYLAERQWGTVREDYSSDGRAWEYLVHDHARSRAYRWGEDGLLGICDREGRLCFALALWNGRDPILKERLFGLTNGEGNHGEDAKEVWYYLDATPTHSYLKGLYRYPQATYPYAELVAENARRGKDEPEYELEDTGILDGGRFFDVLAEYAKAEPDDLSIRITVTNRGPEKATLHLLPTLWFRNTWSWGRAGEGYWPKPRLSRASDRAVLAEHASLGTFRLQLQPLADSRPPSLLFTENETNAERLFKTPNPTPYVKDAFHEYLVAGRTDAVNPGSVGTKAAAHYVLELESGASQVVKLRLHAASHPLVPSLSSGFDALFDERIREADAFYAARLSESLSPEERSVSRQAYAGLLWSKQFFYYDVKTWLEGDPSQPAPAPERRRVRNTDWDNLYNRDVLSIPDKWEYPWYAAWDLAFHMIPLSQVDPEFAKEQLVLLLREWYMHPSGQIPAYEFAFSDVNPPVHAWAAWRVYKMTGARGKRDTLFLARVFQKLLLNFTWWVNRKDPRGQGLFAGGFLGLDNIGVFDRSQPLPSGMILEQADGTAWMAFYCITMMAMAIELSKDHPAYEDLASKFFEHFVRISDAMNCLGGTGLWSEEDGFYYDHLVVGGADPVQLRIRSMVGLVPLFAVSVLEDKALEKMPGFYRRMQWFLENRPDLAGSLSYLETQTPEGGSASHRLLAIPSRRRLERMLGYLLDENEFLSPYGIRSLSRVHEQKPYVFHAGGHELRVEYAPGESRTGSFGGNSNWRGPVWFPVNYLLIEALERYHHFYGKGFTIECPARSGVRMDLGEVAQELARRLCQIFMPDSHGVRPYRGVDWRFRDEPIWQGPDLFHEYFHGDTGRGLGASHQTGWTALVVRCLEDAAKARGAAPRA
jgi:hypothetical protein